MKQGTDFGIVPGLGDNTGPLLAATAWVNVSGAMVELPPGEMRTSAPLVLTTAGGGFIGQGSHELPTGIPNGSTIVHTGTTGDTLTLSGAAHPIVEGILFAPLYHKTSGAEVKVKGSCSRVNLSRCTSIYAFRPFHVEASSWTTFEDIRCISTFGSAHIYVSGAPDGSRLNDRLSCVRCITGQNFPSPGNGLEPTTATAKGPWAPGASRATGDFVQANGYLWECVQPGVTAGSGTGPSLPAMTFATDAFTSSVQDGTCRWQMRFNQYLIGLQVDSKAIYTVVDDCDFLIGQNGIAMTNSIGTGAPHTLFIGGGTACDHNYGTGINLSAGENVVIDNMGASCSATGAGVSVLSGHGGGVSFGYGFRGPNNCLGPTYVAPGVPNVRIA